MTPRGFAAVPRADFLSTTYAKGDGALVWASVDEVMADLPGAVYCSEPRPSWVLGDGGFVGLFDSPTVSKVQLTGSALVALAACSLLGAVLRVLGEYPHRVTRLDVCLDKLQDGPTVVNRIYSKAKRGEVQLTRKACPVSRYMSPGADGRETGTVYLGAKRARVRAKVYDKQHHLRSLGLPDPGPFTRFELTVTGLVGATLHDAFRPGPLFWHYMSGLLPPPVDVPPWVAHGEGFVLPARPELPPAGRLKRRLESSSELHSILTQAAGVPGGWVVLRTFLHRYGFGVV